MAEDQPAAAGPPPVMVELPPEMLSIMSAAFEALAEKRDAEAAAPPPYERQGNEFEPGTEVRLKGTRAQVVSDDRFITDDAGNLVRNPGGHRVIDGNLGVDAPITGVVIGHEPAVWPRLEERRHVVRMLDGTVNSCDFIDIEAASSEPPAPDA